MIRFRRLIAWDCFAYEHLDFSFENGIHSVEGLNGSAKTSIFMTLEQGLFNRNSKGALIDEVHNTITGKPYEIEVHFSKGPAEYVVVNSRKKGTIEIFKDGKPKHVKRIPDNLKIIESILGVDFTMFQDLIYQSPGSSVNLLEKDSDAARKAFLNNILKLDDIDSALEHFKALDKELSGKSGSIEVLKSQIRKAEESIVDDYDKEQDEIPLEKLENDIEAYHVERDSIRSLLEHYRREVDTHRASLKTAEDSKESKARLKELVAYTNKITVTRCTAQALIDKQANLKIERQKFMTQLEEDRAKLKVIEYNDGIHNKKYELLAELKSLPNPGSEAALTEALNSLTNTRAMQEAELATTQTHLTALMDCVKMGTCPTCKQSVDADIFTYDMQEIVARYEQCKLKFTDTKVSIDLHKTALVAAKRQQELQHKLEILEASFKACDKTLEEAEYSINVVSKLIDSHDEELKSVQQSLETRKVYEAALAEIDKLKAKSGVSVDARDAEKKLKESHRMEKDAINDLEAVNRLLSVSSDTLKNYQEFNTVQRTIKAVNAQKKAYNDATRLRLEGLYKELDEKERKAGLVKQWLQLLGPKGFRVHKMNTFLSHLNSSMKKYSELLSDGKLRCVFFMNNGEIDYSVTDCNKTISWSCWSAGEKARIKMACLFAELELLEVTGAVSFNVLVLDEIFSALDHAGKEGLFRVLNYLKDRDRAIYTISHTQLASDREYDSVVKAYKQESGTTIVCQ